MSNFIDDLTRLQKKKRLEYEQDELVEEYMKPIGGYNPPQSMNLNRYSHA